MEGIEVVFQEERGGEVPEYLSLEAGRAARRFHMTMEGYQATPLVELKHLAGHLGLKGIYIKDESKRFGLNAFKALGGVYAVARYLGQRLGLKPEELDFAALKSREVRDQVGEITFITATDGNHGRAVAWAAQQLGQKAEVYLPQGSAAIRVEAIRETGARAYVTDMNYDDTVRLARKRAEEMGWPMMQDTAWEGYTQVPQWITQGYTTLVSEALDQMALKGAAGPTHVFLQAGVGALAASVLGYLVKAMPQARPKGILVEPARAACFFKSASLGDGKPHVVGGDLKTSMAGLACGEPSPLAWPIIRDFCSAYFSCDEFVTARGMRILGNPAGDDSRIISGESGAVGLGLLSLLMESPAMAPHKDKLGLTRDSRVLIISSEGDTDPENYRRVVWDGKEPLPGGGQ